MRSLTLSDDGSTVEIRVGETLTVRLSENATTGYRWTPDGVDANIVELLPEEPSYRSDAVGSGGEVTFRARAVAPGAARLAFSKRRSWEGKDSTVERFSVEVVVRAED